MADNNAVSSGEGQQQQANVMKRTIKDSVFTNLFQDKKYLLQLYKALHPEDTDVTEDKLTDITVNNPAASSEVCDPRGIRQMDAGASAWLIARGNQECADR